MYKISIGIAFGFLMFSNAAMATCSGNPGPLTNGTTADGLDVIANFDNILGCLNSAINFTNNVGIGITPTYPLDVEGGSSVGSAIARFNATAVPSSGAG